MMKTRNSAWWFCGLGLLMTAGCGDEFADNAGAQVYQNLIFTHTARIDAATDGSNEQPGFSWMATGERHVLCAVFAYPIHVQDNLITNPEDVVWIWHSGLGTGREGNIRFADGVTDLASSAAPAPLEPGNYYWAVWALDDEGHPRASSVEYSLRVP